MLDTTFEDSLQSFWSNTRKDRYLSEKIISDFKKHFPVILDSFKSHGPLDILDIGSGTGNTTCKLFRKLKNITGKRLCIEALDPCQKWNMYYQIQARKNRISRGLRRIINNKWENFCSEKRYNFIIACHSFYGIRDWDCLNSKHANGNMLKKIFHYLRPNGIACIILESRSNTIRKMRQRFIPVIHKVPYFSLDNFLASLKHIGLNYELTENTKASVNITEIMPINRKIGQIKKGMVSLLSFFLLVPPKDYERIITRKLQKEIDEFLLNYAVKCSNGLKYMLSDNDLLIWITKN